MGKPEKIYPFRNEKCSIFEIWKYYYDKGIQIKKDKLSVEIRKKATEVGIQNMTEKMVEDIVFNVARYRGNMASLIPSYSDNCKKEFGEERWENAIPNQRTSFRNRIKVAKEDLKTIEKNEATENIELGVENGRTR